jgi:hypothetical protein
MKGTNLFGLSDPMAAKANEWLKNERAKHKQISAFNSREVRLITNLRYLTSDIVGSSKYERAQLQQTFIN